MGLILDQIVEGIECTSQHLSRRSDRSGALACPYFVGFIYCFYIIAPLFIFFFSFISSFSLFFIFFFLMILAEDREGNSILLDRVDQVRSNRVNIFYVSIYFFTFFIHSFISFNFVFHLPSCA